MSLIQFSAQYGGGDSRKIVSPYHIQLNNIFYKDDKKSGYFRRLKFFSIIFRVSGSIRDFNSEGPENLKKVKSREILTIDLTIPQSRWDGVSEIGLKTYISEGIRECVDIFIQKCEKIGEDLNKEKVLFDLDEGIKEFMEKDMGS